MLDLLIGLVVEGVKDFFHSPAGHNVVHAAVHHTGHAIGHALDGRHDEQVKSQSKIKKRKVRKVTTEIVRKGKGNASVMKRVGKASATKKRGGRK